jgi:hypothetical protein|tara:strand:- start:58 stop:501 length:444 start_codon:yes stop_codon:yes gene_type:complete
MKDLKYEYLLFTWGGFYNKEHSKIHKEKAGYQFYDSKEERDAYVLKLKKIEQDLGAKHLMISKYEGYNVRIETVLHRVIKFRDKEYYSNYSLALAYPYDLAKGHLENKWYPGFNDYPLGEKFDYENNDIEIVQEWITGAFDINEELY